MTSRFHRRPSGNYFIVREEFLDIVEWDEAEALLLSAFDRWDTHLLNHYQYQLPDDVQEDSDKLQDVEIWMQLSRKKIQRHFLAFVGITKIVEAIDKLVERGFLEVRSVGVGKNTEYKLNMAAINGALDSSKPRAFRVDKEPVKLASFSMTRSEHGEKLDAAPCSDLNTSMTRSEHAPCSDLNEFLIGSSTSLNNKEEVPLRSEMDDLSSTVIISNPVKNSFSPQPPSGEAMVNLYNRSRGTKKLNKTDATGFREAIDRLQYSADEVDTAFGAFLADDYWRKEKYPWRAFIKNFSRYVVNEAPAREITPVVPAHSASQDDSPALQTPLTSGKPQVSDPSASLPWPVTVWNEIVTAGNPIVGWDPGSRTAKALQETLKNPVFAEQFYSICKTVQQIKLAGKSKHDMTFSWIVKDGHWLEIANGDYNWAANANSAGGKTATMGSACDRLIAKIQAQKAARLAAEGAAAQ